MHKMFQASQEVIDFVKRKPRERLVFTAKLSDGLDLGKTLSQKISSELDNPRLSLKVKDVLDKLLWNSVKDVENLGECIMIRNVGILFEDELKINIEHFLKKYSTDNTLIIEWPGELDQDKLYFLSKEKGLKVDLKNITHTFYEV